MKSTSKRLKIAIGINSLVSTTQPAYSNHVQVFFRLGRNHPNIDFCFINPPRMSIDRMRNMAAEICLDNEFDYLLFIDDDVLVPIMSNVALSHNGLTKLKKQPDWLDKMLACKADIVAGDVFVRGYPFNHMAFRHPKGDKNGLMIVHEWSKKEPTIALVDAVGFSLCLISCELLKKVDKPFFITGPTNTEDVYFCMKARSVDPECSIVVDRSIQCGHILWQEILDVNNKPAYKKYYEKVYGKPAKQKSGDRGGEYLKLVESVLK